MDTGEEEVQEEGIDEQLPIVPKKKKPVKKKKKRSTSHLYKRFTPLTLAFVGLSVCCIAYTAISIGFLIRSTMNPVVDKPVVVDGTINTPLLLKRLSEFVAVPQELPHTLLVKDVDSVRSQSAFLAIVEEGDIIVAFTGSRLLLVYRPSTHRIVSMSPILSE
jgi:hypothetical protein